ncbi:MAG: hypothetical protein IPG50_03055 [Myxococcales bacterium]|nr:hypothetical protein [Myxococcales bacterium]
MSFVIRSTCSTMMRPYSRFVFSSTASSHDRLGSGANHVEWCSKLVRHAGGEAPNGGQAVGVP